MTIDQLQKEWDTLIASLRALHNAYNLAVATGQDVAAGQLLEQIKKTAAQANVVAAQIKQIDEPSTAVVFLAKVGDVVIDGAKTGTTAVMDVAGNIVTTAGHAVGNVVTAVGDTAKGFGSLAKMLPFLLLAVVAVVGIGLYTGSLGAKASV